MERTVMETTPNAKAKSLAGQVSGIDVGRRPSTPGAKAKAVGVSRVNQIPCSFFLRGRRVKGETCMFSHATQQMDPKQSDSQPVSAECGRSSSTEKGKRSERAMLVTRVDGCTSPKRKSKSKRCNSRQSPTVSLLLRCPMK